MLRVCGQDPARNVFVAARVREGGLLSAGSALGVSDSGSLRALCWTSANVVPVECDDAALDVLAPRLRRQRRRASSVFGPAEQVLPLWERLQRSWGTPRSFRPQQPMLAATTLPSSTGRPIDPRVRLARPDELDLVLPASVAMFTEEIGYPPYLGSDREYRGMVSGLLGAGHTYVLVENGRVVFKADVGSHAFDVAQIQGVWVAPDCRGQGLAAPAMNAVLEHVLTSIAPTATLYVNAYNEPALRTYARAGFQQIATFATIIL